jgi:hypothetical protein
MNMPLLEAYNNNPQALPKKDLTAPVGYPPLLLKK